MTFQICHFPHLTLVPTLLLPNATVALGHTYLFSDSLSARFRRRFAGNIHTVEEMRICTECEVSLVDLTRTGKRTLYRWRELKGSWKVRKVASCSRGRQTKVATSMWWNCETNFRRYAPAISARDQPRRGRGEEQVAVRPQIRSTLHLTVKHISICNRGFAFCYLPLASFWYILAALWLKCTPVGFQTWKPVKCSRTFSSYNWIGRWRTINSHCKCEGLTLSCFRLRIVCWTNKWQ